MERIAVGTDYKQKGQKEAIKTGFRLVGPRLADMMEEAQKIGNEFSCIAGEEECGLRTFASLRT